MIEQLRRVGRSIIPKPAYSLLARALNWTCGVRKLGRSEYRRLQSVCANLYRADGTHSQFQFPDLLHPISVRNGLSDPDELIHTIVRETYAPYGPRPDTVQFVIDAGANFGDTATWFLSRYPAATLVALEPDQDNFDMLQRNVAPYQPRATLLKAGLWPKRAKLKVVETQSRTGLSVVEVVEGEPFDCEGYSPDDLLTLAGKDKIDLFKIDIEGSETALFAGACDGWLERTRVIMMEIHSPEADVTVRRAIARHRFEYHLHREVHIFINQNL